MRDVAVRCLARVRKRLRSDERGAIAVLVAILLGGGVLLGMAALVVDVGQIYLERAQVQDGADAAALAVANSCALGGPCDTTVAQNFVNQNSASGVGIVNQVCGPSLAVGCAPSQGGIANCPDAPSSDLNYIDVATTSEAANGSTVIPTAFANAILGGNYQGTTVQGCGQASWGPPSAATVTPITVPLCAWNLGTNNGSYLAPPPSSGTPPASADVVMQLSTLSGNCGAGTGPTFDWTHDPNGTCSTYISGPTYLGGLFGDEDLDDCDPVLPADLTNHSVLIVPVYSAFTTGGDSGGDDGGGDPSDWSTYTLDGFAAFVITGYQLGDMSAPDWLNPSNTCPSGQACIEGYFAHAIVPTTGPIGGTDLGAVVVELTG